MLAGVVCLFLCFLCSNSTISLQSRVRFNSCLTPFVLPTAEKNNPGKRYGAMETAPSLPEKCCPICVNFTAASIPLLLSHLHVVHSNEARFLMMCGIGGCSYTASSYSALYSHVYRNHPEAGVIKKRVSQDTASSALHASAATGGSAFLGDSDSYDIDLLTGKVVLMTCTLALSAIPFPGTVRSYIAAHPAVTYMAVYIHSLTSQPIFRVGREGSGQLSMQLRLCGRGLACETISSPGPPTKLSTLVIVYIVSCMNSVSHFLYY